MFIPSGSYCKMLKKKKNTPFLKIHYICLEGVQFSVTKEQLTYTRKCGIIIKENTASPSVWGEQKPRELFNYCHGRLSHSQYLCWAAAEGQGVKYPYYTAGNSAHVDSGAEPSFQRRACMSLQGCWGGAGWAGLSSPVLGSVGSRQESQKTVEIKSNL